jgi:chaperonin GroES
MQGTIIAVGAGKQSEDGKITPMAVAVGDTVLYGKYAGTEISIDGDDYLIMREADIFGIIK